MQPKVGGVSSAGHARESSRDETPALPSAGKTTLVEQAGPPSAGPPPVQLERAPGALPHLRLGDSDPESQAPAEIASRGVQSGGGPLPHLDRIQASFGRHDVSGVTAHQGPATGEASRALGARAFAFGDDVGFGSPPDLHTTAHEAAHVVQQRAGVQLEGGIGEAGDAYERHADAVADHVVQGKSAEGLLDEMAPAGGAPAVQRRAVQLEGEEMTTRGGRDHVIQRGDTLSRIAARTYGHVRYWRDIMRANPSEVHRDGNLIYAGHTLHLPRIQVPAAEAPTVHLDDLGHDPEAPTEEAVCSPEDPALGPPDASMPRDYRAVLADLDRVTPRERMQILMEIRQRGEWEAFIAALDDRDVARVQAWMPAQEGQAGDFTLEERISQAHNSERGRAALAAVDAIAGGDLRTPPRITPRIRELLTLGVALPALEGNDLASEGILTVQSATRAAEALIMMPTPEYLRISMQLQLVGTESEWLQQFNILKAVAARRDRFTDTNAGNDSLQDLEDFSDRIRDMNEADLVRQTRVTQSDGQLGMQQRFTMSCNVSSGLVVRAESDPVEALRLQQNGEMAIDNLGGEVAQQTEQTLEAHGGNVAVARQPTTVISDVNAAITALAASAPVDELTAVSSYMNNLAFDAGKYAAGIARVRTQIGRAGYPNDQAMRLVRETAAGGAQPGLTPDQLRTEMNGTLGVGAVTGQTASVDWDQPLWELFLAAGRIVPSPVPSTWTTRISAMLGRARPRLEAGEDVTFNVYWSGGGGHTMTFINVRDVGGTVSYLIHDTWTGRTTWVPESPILQGNWPGVTASQGILCGLIG